jgi:hypothetical protein
MSNIIKIIIVSLTVPSIEQLLQTTVGNLSSWKQQRKFDHFLFKKMQIKVADLFDFITLLSKVFPQCLSVGVGEPEIKMSSAFSTHPPIFSNLLAKLLVLKTTAECFNLISMLLFKKVAFG